MAKGRLRPLRVAGAVRNRLGSRRRRSYATWGAMPDRPTAGSDWWVDDPHWFPAGTPPRQRTKIDLLIEGEDTFRAAWQAIMSAKLPVWLVDWAMAPDMDLVRGKSSSTIPPAAGPTSTGYTVLDLLTARADEVDVRVLLWNGSLFFEPHSFAAKRGLKRMRAANPHLHGVVDTLYRFTHCHHQKTIVVDGRIAFVGGLDMTNQGIDRWDTTAHPMREGLNWHDLCLCLEGDAAVDVARNFMQRWHEV